MIWDVPGTWSTHTSYHCAPSTGAHENVGLVPLPVPVGAVTLGAAAGGVVGAFPVPNVCAADQGPQPKPFPARTYALNVSPLGNAVVGEKLVPTICALRIICDCALV